MRIASVHAAPLQSPSALAAAGMQIPQSAPWTALEGVPGHTAPTWADVACMVTLDDGTWGFGATAFAGPVVPIINDHLAPLVVGAEVETIEGLTRLWDRIDRAAGAHYGTTGVASYALSAVDLALWDCFGKHVGRPVWELLGGERRAIPTYATGSSVEPLVDMGHRAVKLPCRLDGSGAVDHHATVQAVATARAVVGDEADLMLDGWDVNDVAAAIELGRDADAYSLRWFEDAIFPEDWPGYTQLREGLTGVPLAAGERWYTHRPFDAMIHGGVVDVVQPDPLWVGGVTPVLRIAATARAHGVDLVLHCGGNDPFGQHLSTALTDITLAEVYYGTECASLAPTYRAYAGASTPEDGAIWAGEAPGFGFAFTRADLERATR